MNKIQSLADQAKKSVPHGLAPDKWIEVYNQKFAELIVKECVAHVRSAAMRASGGCTIVGEEELWLANDMEKHFGVEE